MTQPKYYIPIQTHENEVINTTNEAVKLFRSQIHYYDHQEHFAVCYLNALNQLRTVQILSIGTSNQLIIDKRLIFNIAVMNLADRIIICHNHTHNDPEPSEEDIITTNEIKQAASLLDIQLLDHIILTKNSHFSFYDKGIL